MRDQKYIELEDLPPHLLEYIFDHIPLPEIVQLSGISHIFLTIGGNVIRKRFFELYSGICRELKALKEELDELPKTEEYFSNRIVLLRCYYFLEMLLSELSLIKAVWRKILCKKGTNSVPIGRLLHEFYSAYYITKARNLPPWHISDETECNIIKYAKLFFECKLKDIRLDRLFGCQILDVLDSMINRQYTIKVKYYPESNLCYIDAIYKLRHPQYLNRPPKLINKNGKITSAEERKKILSYFVSLVRINNRVILREEQYHRETEASRSSEINLLDLEIEHMLNSNSAWTMKDVRSYSSVFLQPVREERKVNKHYEFEETYRSGEFSHSTSIEKKFICNIQIKCPLNEAPLNIIDCWSRYKRDLLSQVYYKPYLIFLEESIDHIFEVDIDSASPDNAGENRLQCTVEVCDSNNNNNFEICRLVFREP